MLDEYESFSPEFPMSCANIQRHWQGGYTLQVFFLVYSATAGAAAHFHLLGLFHYCVR